mmetsp:Transcript_54773/g.125810  ORF Transcript_54773/g.125810 Transcript_54773/m.125810 type:complete len:321 (+) Transcript_54773:276-1238(+)
MVCGSKPLQNLQEGVEAAVLGADGRGELPEQDLRQVSIPYAAPLRRPALQQGQGLRGAESPPSGGGPLPDISHQIGDQSRLATGHGGGWEVAEPGDQLDGGLRGGCGDGFERSGVQDLQGLRRELLRRSHARQNIRDVLRQQGGVPLLHHTQKQLPHLLLAHPSLPQATGHARHVQRGQGTHRSYHLLHQGLNQRPVLGGFWGDGWQHQGEVAGTEVEDHGGDGTAELGSHLRPSRSASVVPGRHDSAPITRLQPPLLLHCRQQHLRVQQRVHPSRPGKCRSQLRRIPASGGRQLVGQGVPRGLEKQQHVPVPAGRGHDG